MIWRNGSEKADKFKVVQSCSLVPMNNTLHWKDKLQIKLVNKLNIK